MPSITKKEQAREARERALEAVNLMRRHGLSLSEAARRAETTPDTVKKYASSAIEAAPDGYRVRASDRLVRDMAVLTPEGKRAVRVQGSRDASLVGEHWNAVRAYLEEGDDSGLDDLEGQSITDSRGQGWELLTDRQEILRFGGAGTLSFEDIYEATA
jgi:hypothetical protein